MEGSAASWKASPASPTGQLSLNAVADADYALTEIQKFNAPVKVVHASDCVAAPTLHFGLSAVGTSLAVDSLTVAGSAVPLQPALLFREACTGNNCATLGSSQGYVDLTGFSTTFTLYW